MTEKKSPELVPPPEPFAKAKREQKVGKLSARVQALERCLDVLLRDQEEMWKTYVAVYRIRHGCDPDTQEVTPDYLDVYLMETDPNQPAE
jgi:hypothetical protein